MPSRWRKGIASLPEPATVVLRTDAKHSKDILVDWQARFKSAYDAELQDWIDSTLKGSQWSNSMGWLCRSSHI